MGDGLDVVSGSWLILPGSAAVAAQMQPQPPCSPQNKSLASKAESTLSLLLKSSIISDPLPCSRVCKSLSNVYVSAHTQATPTQNNHAA